MAFLPPWGIAAVASLHPRCAEDNLRPAGKGQQMQLSLIVRGQHPAGDDIRARLDDNLALVKRAEAPVVSQFECNNLDLLATIGSRFPYA
jgi:hypothetical protein